jgi:hypothetical protein
MADVSKNAVNSQPKADKPTPNSTAFARTTYRARFGEASPKLAGLEWIATSGGGQGACFRPTA